MAWPGSGSHCASFEATQLSPGPLTCPGMGWSAGGPLLLWPISESPASQEAHAGQAGGSRGPGLQPQCPPPYTPTLPCVPAAVSGFQHLQSEKVELESGLDSSPALVPGHKPVRTALCTWEGVPESQDSPAGDHRLPVHPHGGPAATLGVPGGSVSILPLLPGHSRDDLRSCWGKRQEMEF